VARLLLWYNGRIMKRKRIVSGIAALAAALVAVSPSEASESCIIDGSTARVCVASSFPALSDFDSWAWGSGWQMFTEFYFLPKPGILMILY